MADNKHPFGLKHDSSTRKEKRGAGASLPGAAAAGGAPASGVFDSGAAVLSTIGRASPNGGASVGLWDALVGAVSKTTGLGALAAGKAVVVGLVVGASTMAAGVSIYIGGSGSEGSSRLGARVFVDEAQDEAPLLTPVKPSAPAEPSSTSGASLDYLSQANGPAPEPEASVDRKVDAPAAVAAAKASEVPNHTAPAAAPAKAPADVPKPKMAKRAMPQARGDPGGKGVVLQSMDSLTGKVGSGFQEVYRPPRTGSFDAMSQSAPRYGANRKIAVNRSGSNAMAQARFANRLSKSGARMGNATGAAHTASQPFDGGNRAGALGNTRAAGTSLGGTGISSSANGLLDSKSVEPPPAPDAKKKGENKTPYQGLVMAAMAALMVGTVLLMIAGKLSSNPAQKPAAQAVAAAAMAAGGAAAALGGVIAGQYDQLTQGMPFIMGGGILAVQAGMVIAKAEKAAQDGAEGVQGAGADAAGQAGQALQSAMGPAMQAMQGQEDGESDKLKEEEKPKRYDVHIDHSKPGTQGNINVPGL